MIRFQRSETNVRNRWIFLDSLVKHTYVRVRKCDTNRTRGANRIQLAAKLAPFPRRVPCYKPCVFKGIVNL